MGLLSLNLPVIGQSSATEDQKVRDALSALQTGINGNLDETNLPNLSAAFTTYERIARSSAELTSGMVAGTYMTSLNAKAVGVGLGGLAVGDCLIHLDPAKYNANARTTKLSLRLTQVQNAAPTAMTVTAQLFPVATYSGAATATPKPSTLGTAVAGSNAAIASAASLIAVDVESGDFNFPAAGYYVITLTTSGVVQANGAMDFVCQLEMRRV